MRLLLIIIMCVVLSGCATISANIEVDPDRAGCVCGVGKFKYGYIQGVSGEGNGCHAYKGKNIKAKITCNADVQEVIVK